MNEDRSTRYHRLKRAASIAGLVWTVVLLGVLLASGISVSMRGVAEGLGARTASPFWATVVAVFAYVVFLSAIHELGSLPLSFYSGFLVERRYELTTQTLRSWLTDQAKSFFVGLVLSALGSELIYWLMRRSPDRW